MSETMEHVKTINSVIRTSLLLILLGGLAYAGWYTYTNYIGPSRQAQQAMKDLKDLQVKFEEQTRELGEVKEERDRLETSIKLLKVDTRVARIHISKVGESDEGEPFFDAVFTEVDQYNDPVAPPREFRLRGDTLHVDTLTCKFEDRYVEESDLLRNASLFVFNKIYGDLDGLKGGYSLDRPNEEGEMHSPGIYFRGAEMTDFERRIWNDFWEIANDDSLQKELGIRANHGEIPYMKVKEGSTYQIQLRSSGGITFDTIQSESVSQEDVKESNDSKSESGESLIFNSN